MSLIKKYQQIFKYAFLQTNSKISNYILYQLSYVLEFFVTIYIWKVNNQSNSEIITYLFFGYIIQRLVFTNVLNFLSVQIFNSKIVNLLLTPISLFKYLLVREVGSRLSINLMSAGIMFLFLPLFITNLTLPSINFVILMPLFLALGFIIDLLISIIFASLVFWLKDGFDPVYNFFTLGTKVLTGIYIPFNYFNPELSQFLVLNPYSFLVYHPMQIFLGKYSLHQQLLVVFGACAWVLVLYFLAKLVFKKGLRQFESNGL